MAHISGLLVIDAPASALNNSGSEPGAASDNTVAVKYIRTTNNETYPYVSAQAFRYWLRTTITRKGIAPGESSPVFREQKVAYTDANPLRYWDDDLLGYMRAPSKKTSAREARVEQGEAAYQTATAEAVTRVSPFRVSTLISIAPTRITSDFGVMSRHDGDAVPYEHQFYHATLKGLFSLDLASAGTFTYMNKSGYRNLDATRMTEAAGMGLLHLESEKAFQLPRGDRTSRVASILMGLAQLEGGAKQAIHYTDVAPSLLLTAVTKGGNNPFAHIVGADRTGQPIVRGDALVETLNAMDGELLSPLYLGWAPGYLTDQRHSFVAQLDEAGIAHVSGHPRVALSRFAADLVGTTGQEWL